MNTDDEPYPPTLSPREIEVLSLLANGTTLKQVACQMKVTKRTAASHLRHARERLGALTRDETVALAVSFGLIDLDAGKERRKQLTPAE